MSFLVPDRIRYQVGSVDGEPGTKLSHRIVACPASSLKDKAAQASNLFAVNSLPCNLQQTPRKISISSFSHRPDPSKWQVVIRFATPGIIVPLDRKSVV